MPNSACRTLLLVALLASCRRTPAPGTSPSTAPLVTPSPAGPRVLLAEERHLRISLDTSHVERQPDGSVRVWLFYEYLAPSGVKRGAYESGFRTGDRQVDVRCAPPLAFRGLGWTARDSAGRPALTVLSSANDPWEFPVPRSIGERGYQRVCELLERG